MRFITTIFCLTPLWLTGCLSKLMDNRISNAVYVGAYAQTIGKWDISRRAYAQAVVDSEVVEWPPARRAILHYEYGRALGVTCFFAASAFELMSAYQLEEISGGPLYMSLTELARLHLDQKKYRIAAEFYQKSFVEQDKADVSSGAPIAYADTLDEYAIALKEIGETQKSETMSAKANELRTKYPDWKSVTGRTPYGTQCTQSVGEVNAVPASDLKPTPQ